MPYRHQHIDKNDINEVIKVLRSDWLTQGPKIKEFENALCKYTGAKYAVVVSNGTAALHIACLAAGIKRGDEVITSPITFVASANCVLYCGGKPIFSDVQDDTININPDEIKKRITKKTKAIIPVHFAGHPCDLEEIKQIAKKHNLIVIEDAAHALGSEYKGSKIGSCKYSDMTIFSFHPVKSITTGEGGVVTTNNKGIYKALLRFRNHGITKDFRLFKNKSMAFADSKPNRWYYEMQTLGFNYRITDLQCALGISQMRRLNNFIQRRREIAAMYTQEFSDVQGVGVPVEEKGKFSAYHLYALNIDFRRFGKIRNEVMEQLKKVGVGTQVHYIPVHLQPYYRKRFGYKKKDFINAESFYERLLSIPIYPRMTGKDVKYVASQIKKVLGL